MTDILRADKPSLEDLIHHGVKGMHWGVRKATASGSSSASPKMSRKDYRAKVRQEKSDFYQKKANDLLKEASKDPELLIKLHSGSTYPTVVTGREFVTHMTNGGLMDIKYTDVYARQTTKNGPYQYAGPSRMYQKPKR